jgi:hypothetical protein
MTPSKQLKLLGISLIVGSTPFFYFYFLMLIPRLLNGEYMPLGEFVFILYLFFIDFWMFHLPGFVLIALGIFCLWKSKHMKIKEI